MKWPMYLATTRSEFPRPPRLRQRQAWLLPRRPGASLRQPEVSHHLPEVSHRLPEVSHRLPEVSHHLPEASHRLPEVSHHLPEASHHLPEVFRRSEAPEGSPRRLCSGSRSSGRCP